ncbi:MAG: MBL fold metallo-hydrolase [Bacteroidota bacterium]
MLVSESFRYQEVSGFKFGYSWIGRPKMFTHIYYVDGLLIDTGQSRARKKILEGTKALNIDRIFITHHHEDHSGNIKPLQKQHQCKAYASELCCKLMKDPPRLSLVQKLTWGDREPSHDLTPVTHELRTPRFNFSLIPIPGHAPDMVALYEPERKWLFSADLYINSYIGYFLKDEGILDQIASLKKVLQLDFKVLFCGHNPQMKNAKQQLAQKLDFLETFYEKVVFQYSQGAVAQEILVRMQLKENRFVKIASQGNLSKLNMVKSAIRDFERQTP